MTIEEEITTWAATRPGWNNQVLQALMTDTVITPETVASIADHLIDGSPVALAPAEVIEDKLATTTSTVTIHGISDVSEVNALATSQHLSFSASALTVVYGENGSGKSGYARLLKAAVRARHREDVLPDIFAPAVGVPSAVVHYAVDGVVESASWPGGAPPVLRKVAFYDEACGDSYVSNDMELTYRPAALVYLDRLIAVSDAVRSEIDKRLGHNAAKIKPLPVLSPSTTTGELLGRLPTSKTLAALDALEALLASAAEVPGDIEALTNEAEREHARLSASDPSLERKRFTDSAVRRETISSHLKALDALLGAPAMERLNTLATTARDLRAAATLASETGFGSEPVPGVGAATWRTLWDAARAFSEAEAYPSRNFPATDSPDDACVLCHQDLDDAARQRLNRFEAFVQDDTSRRAGVAEEALRQARVKALASLPSAERAEVALELLEEAGDTNAKAVRDLLTNFTNRRDLLATWDPAAGDHESADAPALGVADTLATEAAQERTKAAVIDDGGFATSLADAARTYEDLRARVALAASYDNVEAEFGRRREQIQLEAAKKETDTSSITRKSTELARVFVTDVVRDRFTRELDRLRLERVTLKDSGGRKGQLLHRPAFLGAARNVALETVLSEGEQTALGLAGFFTEAYFDESKSSLVFDDPISSLDANRRRYVAEQLVGLAADRQVIVFTHDQTFAAELRRASQEKEVGYTPRSVERSGAKVPGICQERHPWDVKDVDDRMKWLNDNLIDIRRNRAEMDSDQYDTAVSLWAGRLSMTWERIVSLEVVGRVFDRGTMQVKPLMFRTLVHVSQEDDAEFQRGYGQTSKWAARHDKSAEIDYTAPELSEMDAELTAVREWRKKIRSYANK